MWCVCRGVNSGRESRRRREIVSEKAGLKKQKKSKRPKL